MRAGIMNGTLLDGLPIASSTGPNRSPSSSVNVLRSTAATFAVWAASSRPKRSFFIQRLSDSAQSSATTAWPSCHLSPSRSVKVYFIPSFETPCLSTICGSHLELLVGAEQRVVDQVGVIAGDVGGRPHRVEDLEVGLGDEAQGPAGLLGVHAAARRTRWRRHSRWHRRGTGDDSSWAHAGSSSADAPVVLHGETARIVARHLAGARGVAGVPEAGTLRASLVDRPIGARRSIRPRRRWVFRCWDVLKKRKVCKETVHGSETIRRWSALLHVQRSAARLSSPRSARWPPRPW